MKDSGNSFVSRDFRFDNAKAFLIITVVVGHLAELLLSTVAFSQDKNPVWLSVLYKCIYIFHMPAFMIVSGRFAKRRVDTNDWITVFNKIIVPYLLIQTCMMLFCNTVNYQSTAKFSYLKPLFGLWYLLGIGLYQLITPQILKVLKRKELLLPISLAVAILLSYQEKQFYGNFQRFVSYYPYFVFGYLTATKEFEICKKALFKILSVFGFFGLVILVINFPTLLQVPIINGKRVYSEIIKFVDFSHIEFLIFLIIKYFLGFIIFFFVLGLVSSKKNIFTPLGKDSTYVYILHCFIIVALTALSKHYGILSFCENQLFALLICMSGIPLSFVLISPPIKKITSWLFAPNFDIRLIAKHLETH